MQHITGLPPPRRVSLIARLLLVPIIDLEVQTLSALLPNGWAIPRPLPLMPVIQRECRHESWPSTRFLHPPWPCKLALARLYIVYLLYWYKSTNTDAEGAALLLYQRAQAAARRHIQTTRRTTRALSVSKHSYPASQVFGR
jgi:hypothetical protein